MGGGKGDPGRGLDGAKDRTGGCGGSWRRGVCTGAEGVAGVRTGDPEFILRATGIYLGWREGIVQSVQQDVIKVPLFPRDRCWGPNVAVGEELGGHCHNPGRR